MNLNTLLGRSNKKSIKFILTDYGEIFYELGMAEIFNRYFASVPLNLDSNVPRSNLDPISFIHNNITSYLFDFDPCTPTEVSAIMSETKITKVDKFYTH